MSHFALVMLGKSAHAGWLLDEVDLDGCESLDDVANMLSDYDYPVRVLALEQDDEYAVLARLDEAYEAIRVFLSNGHAAENYPLAELFADGLQEIGGDPLDGDEDAPAAYDTAPFGDPSLLGDLGMQPAELVELAVREAMLPIDLIETVCERLGCLDEFEAVRQ